jgi:predicted dehydrogenase
MTVRWGLAGPGPVADKVLRDLVPVEKAVLTAVGSRSAERAAAFARDGRVPRAATAPTGRWSRTRTWTWSTWPPRTRPIARSRWPQARRSAAP